MNTHEIKCLNLNIMSKMRKIMSRVDPQTNNNICTTKVRPCAVCPDLPGHKSGSGPHSCTTQ